MWRSRLLLLCVSVFIVVLRASADDTLATLGAGGLVPLKTSKVVMESEDLQISTHQVTVKYVFQNTSDLDVDAIVLFPLPTLEGGMVAMSPMDVPSKNPVNFMAFKVWVNGHPVSPHVEVRALIDGKDITEKLRSLGLPISVLDRNIESAFGKLPEWRRLQLEKENLVVDLDSGDPNPVVRATEHSYWGLWNTRIQYYWHQRFPAQSAVRVLHTYKPVVGGSYIAWNDDGELTVKPYCGNSATLERIAKLKARSPKRADNNAALWEREIQFILTTANNWSGPIRHFHLSVALDHSEDIFASCTPGMKRTSPTRYDLNLSNFRPKSELDFLMLQLPTNKSTLPLN